MKKSFSIEELIIRIESLVGRQHQNVEIKEFEIGSYHFDFKKQILYDGNQTHCLTSMEAEILLILIENKNSVVERSVMLRKIWGSDTFFTGRSLNALITKLKKKLYKDQRIKILNTREKGYKVIV